MGWIFTIAVLAAISFVLYKNFLQDEGDSTSDKVMMSVLAIPIVAYTLYQDWKASRKEK